MSQSRTQRDARFYAASPANVETECRKALEKSAAWQRRIPSWMDPAEFDEVAVIAVMKARDTYEPVRNILFSTWCSTKVQFALIEEDRRQRRKGPSVSLDGQWRFWDNAPVCTMEDSSDPCLLDIISTEDAPHAERIQARKSAERIVDLINELVERGYLAEFHREVFLLRTLGGKKQATVARQYELTASRIHQIEDECREKVLWWLKKRGDSGVAPE